MTYVPNYLVSSTEPPLILSLGLPTIVPEKYGADILWNEPVVHGLVGVQRKAVPDLINSVRDGRLHKELAQLQQVKLAFLIVEGRPRWDTSGMLLDENTRWTRVQHNSLLRSIQMRGVMVEFTDTTAETVVRVQEIANWCHKPDHVSLDRRPKPAKTATAWGSRTDRDWGCHVLQSIDGIGPKQAGLIWDHFGGLPFELTCTREELLEIEGFGPKKVEMLMKAFGVPAVVDAAKGGV